MSPLGSDCSCNPLLTLCITGVSRRLPRIHRNHRRPPAPGSGDERAAETRVTGGEGGARVRSVMPDHWEPAFSDPGELRYIE